MLSLHNTILYMITELNKTALNCAVLCVNKVHNFLHYVALEHFASLDMHKNILYCRCTVLAVHFHEIT